MNITLNELRKLSRRVASTDAYIDSIFNLHSKVLTVRVDFYYNLHHPANAYLTEEIARGHMATYLNNFRSFQNLGELVVGHLIRLERADQRGFHFHCLFFLDGQRVNNDFYYAQILGNYWVRTLSSALGRSGFILSEGEMLGSFNICDPNDYVNSGIGMIDYFDAEKIQCLKERVASYLLKPNSNVNTGFWKGQIKQVNTAKGRPRMYQ